MSIYDGYYEIVIEHNKVYLDLFPPMNDGKVIVLDEIIEELKKQNIQNYDVNKISQALDGLQEQVRINLSDDGSVIEDETETRSEKEKAFVLSVSEDKMKLFITFYPVENDEAISKEEIIKEIKKLQLVVAVDESILDVLLQDFEYNRPIELIAGTPAIDGRPNKIQYNFKMKKDLAPEIDDDGNVNYHKLHLVTNVVTGGLLAELIYGTEGVNGTDLFGKEVIAKKPKPVRILRGKNTKLSEDKTKLYAEVDGLVKLEGDKIVVNNAYEVANNVGVSTGDIDFNGTVIVNGNITSGFKVIAKGDIEVLGVIESAEVTAGGTITAHRGIQGGGKCKIRAKGDLNAKYIENADVRVNGMIHSEAILHSTVSASDEIVVEGKKGMISGGVVTSGVMIQAITLGSHMGTYTEVEVGIDPFLLEEYNELKKNLPKIKNELVKLDQIINLLNKKKELEGPLDEKKQQMYISATRNKIFLANKVNKGEKRFEELKELVGTRNDGKIVVKGTIYSGVKVSIGTAIMRVRDSIQYVELVKSGADIKMNAL